MRGIVVRVKLNEVWESGESPRIVRVWSEGELGANKGSMRFAVCCKFDGHCGEGRSLVHDGLLNRGSYMTAIQYHHQDKWEPGADQKIYGLLGQK
jgi:hypothetical protein